MVKIFPQSSGKLLLYLNLISELGFLSILFAWVSLNSVCYLWQFLPVGCLLQVHDFSPYVDFPISRFPDFLTSCSHLQSYYLPDHALSFFTHLFWSISHRAMITCHNFLFFFFFFLLRVTRK